MSKVYHIPVPARPIMSGLDSTELWDDINKIKSGSARYAVYSLGCKCQAIEGLIECAMERIEVLERKLESKKK